MTNIAVAVIHGIGTGNPEFAEGLRAQLERRCHADCGDGVKVASVYWADVFQPREDDLWGRMLAEPGARLHWPKVRRFMVDFLADAVAYQRNDGGPDYYEEVHRKYIQTLRTLAESAGPGAPLVVVAHSLGTVITSNFMWDLQKEFQRGAPPTRSNFSPELRAAIGETPLERGETLALLYSCGSPIALWSLRYADFGTPITVPAPLLGGHHPPLEGVNGGKAWVNVYDKDDAVAFPLAPLNDGYRAMVTDLLLEVNRPGVMGFIEGMTPLSHLAYFDDEELLREVSRGVIDLYKRVNAGTLTNLGVEVAG